MAEREARGLSPSARRDLLALLLIALPVPVDGIPSASYIL